MMATWITILFFLAVLVGLIVYFLKRDAAAKQREALNPTPAPRPSDPLGAVITGVSYLKGLVYYGHVNPGLNRKLGEPGADGVVEVSRTMMVFTCHTRQHLLRMVLTTHFGLVGYGIEWLLSRSAGRTAGLTPVEYRFQFFRHDIEKASISGVIQGNLVLKTAEGTQRFSFPKKSKEALTTALREAGYPV